MLKDCFILLKPLYVRMLDVIEIDKQTQSTRWEMVVLGVVKYISY